jgi:hypothetical protein
MSRKKESQKERIMCNCGIRRVAINYIKDKVIHYRTVCSVCSKKNKKPKEHYPNYKKKISCEKCGFVALFPEQLSAYKTTNPTYTSVLKTVCLNCKEELSHTKQWTQGDLIADF